MWDHEGGHGWWRKKLEAILGLGQGRYLDRAVASFLEKPNENLWQNTSHRICKTPVAHRKGGYLLGVAERYLRKYVNYYHAVLLRSSHALAGRGNHSFSKLEELRTGMGNLSMLSFALGLVGGLEKCVAQITSQSQDAAALIWMTWRSLEGPGGAWKPI